MGETWLAEVDLVVDETGEKVVTGGVDGFVGGKGCEIAVDASDAAGRVDENVFFLDITFVYQFGAEDEEAAHRLAVPRHAGQYAGESAKAG